MPTIGLALLVAACTTTLHPELETDAYRSFPSTARVQKTCVIEVTGPSEFSQWDGPLRTSFDPQATLREGLVLGLQRTCLRTAADPRAGDPAALDLAREIGVLAKVTAISLRRGPPDDGKDEVEMVAAVTLYRAGAPPFTKVVEGRSAQLASYDDVESAIALAVVDAVDGVNQLIFEDRGNLSTSSEGAPEQSEKTSPP